MRNTLFPAILLGTSLLSGAAVAQGLPAPVAEILKVGAKVHGPQGADVGIIEKIEGGNVVIFTGAHRATLPATSLGSGEKGLVIGLTKAQLDSAVAAAAAKVDAALDAALVADAEVHSSDGVLVGTIQKVEGEDVTIDLATGSPVTLQKAHMGIKDGKVGLHMSAAELQAAVSAAKEETPTG